MYATLKLVHVSTALLSIAGFSLRGIFWMLRKSPMLRNKAVRVVPHVLDTVFLFSGVALVRVLALPVATQPWLMAKLLALLVYIWLGFVALRFGRTPAKRAIAFVAALATFAYIAGVALSKSMLSWVALSHS